jgi:hypothetical protein
LRKTFTNFIFANWFQLLFLTILIAIAYQSILNFAFVIDDIGAVDAYRKFSDLIPFFKSPAESVRSLMYLIMYNLGNGAPWPFHLVSLLFHIWNVFLIYLIISKMINKDVAFITSIIAAVHPIFVESVTWISGSPYVQYSFFCLLSLYFFMHGENNARHDSTRRGRISARNSSFNKMMYVSSFISFVMATLLSEKAIVLSFKPWPFLFLFFLFRF